MSLRAGIESPQQQIGCYYGWRNSRSRRRRREDARLWSPRDRDRSFRRGGEPSIERSYESESITVIEMCQEQTVPVDFNNRDEDGAVRLVTLGIKRFIDENNLVLENGARIRMTDGELMATGTVLERGGMWVAKIDEWEDES